MQHFNLRLLCVCHQMESSDRNATTVQAHMSCRRAAAWTGLRDHADGRGCCWRSLGSYLPRRAAWAATVDAGDLALVQTVPAAAPPQGPPSAAASELVQTLPLSVHCMPSAGGFSLLPAKEVKSCS